jgi:hypothetical protein
MDTTETGSAAEAKRKRRNVMLVIGAVVVLAAVPAVCSGLEQGRSEYETYADAQRAGAFDRGVLPKLVPPSARGIYEKHDLDNGHRWVRFVYAPADVPAMTAGLRQLDTAQVSRLPVAGPGWAKWWMLNDGTMSSKQGKHLLVYDTGDGYLALDPRTSVAYYWTRDTPAVAGPTSPASR